MPCLAQGTCSVQAAAPGVLQSWLPAVSVPPGMMVFIPRELTIKFPEGKHPVPKKSNKNQITKTSQQINNPKRKEKKRKSPYQKSPMNISHMSQIARADFMLSSCLTAELGSSLSYGKRSSAFHQRASCIPWCCFAPLRAVTLPAHLPSHLQHKDGKQSGCTWR